jgi:hypothetical protein
VKHNVKTPQYDVYRSTPTFSMISVRSSVYPHTQSINVKVKVIPQEATVTQGVPGRLRPRTFLTFGTTRVVGREP